MGKLSARWIAFLVCIAALSAPEGIDTLTTITCQYRWAAHGRPRQNQPLAIVAANPNGFENP
jgi:hypothetical protein